jgi:hypothetical protein
MDKSQMQVRPGFVLGLALIFVFAWLISLLLPSVGGPTRARNVLTRIEEKDVAIALSQYASKIGGITNTENSFAFRVLVSTASVSHNVRTNTINELLDFWDTPFRITTMPPTNFIVRSAGPDRQFGDADDIVFNSASNDFVKP